MFALRIDITLDETPRALDSGGLYVLLQAEDGIRDLVRSRGLGDVYKRQTLRSSLMETLVIKAGGGAGVDLDAICADVAALVALSLIHI